MTDDLASAYSSIYNKKEEDKEQLDEALPLVPLAMKAATTIGKKMIVDKGKEMLGNVAKNVMGGGKKQARGGTANNLEHVEIEHLDGSTTEIVDVVKPEPLADKEDQEALHDRLWDQVAANLTTLGEMAGVRYQVSPVEELEEKKADKDYDGDGEVESKAKEYRGVIHNKIQQKKGGKEDGKDTSSVKETFNVKSPVIFSKPEEKVEESISEETIEKYASSISKAHKAIKK